MRFTAMREGLSLPTWYASGGHRGVSDSDVACSRFVLAGVVCRLVVTVGSHRRLASSRMDYPLAVKYITIH